MEKPKKLSPEFIRDPDFLIRYANNVQFEGSSWDLKLIFGQTDLSIAPNAVVQHTAITIPWPYIKVFSYLFQAQIAAHEAENGRVVVPRNILNAPPIVLPDEMASSLRHPNEGLAAVQRIWKEFIAANPEAEL